MAIEHPHQAPADKAVVERLVRTVAGRRVLPLKAAADHVSMIREVMDVWSWA